MFKFTDFLSFRRIEGDVHRVLEQQHRPIGVQPARAPRLLIEGNVYLLHFCNVSHAVSILQIFHKL